MLEAGSFTSYITEFLEIYNEEIKDEMRWEVWLHKVYEQSYQDFVRECEQNEPAKTQAETTETLSATINTSAAILQGFVPDDL